MSNTILWSVEHQGTLFGPYNAKQLRSLAANGVISSQTVLTSTDGRKATACQLRGMTFGPSQPFAPPPPLIPVPPPLPSSPAEASPSAQSVWRTRARWILIVIAILFSRLLMRSDWVRQRGNPSIAPTSMPADSRPVDGTAKEL